MIAETPEYLSANIQIMKINNLIETDRCFFRDMKPITESDIINLGLDLLGIFIMIHHRSFDSDKDIPEEDKRKMGEHMWNMLSSPIVFAEYSNNAIDTHRDNNEALQDVLLAIETVDDKDLLINKILSREILK